VIQDLHGPKEIKRCSQHKNSLTSNTEDQQGVVGVRWLPWDNNVNHNWKVETETSWYRSCYWSIGPFDM